MKTLIIYKSHKGSTKQYAEWIHEEIVGSEIYSMDHFNPSKLNEYDKIVVGSCIYAGRMQALEFLTKYWNEIKSKKIFFFSVGVLPPDASDSQRMYSAIPSRIRNSIEYEKLPGQLPNNLNFFQKLIYGNLLKADLNLRIDKGAIKPIIEYINS